MTAIPYSSYHGSAAELCSKGRATEFIQPWYVPISTTPENTGMAVGGIGNTFTLTPLGTTPCFNFIPGLFTENRDSELNLSHFGISIAEEESELTVTSSAEMAQLLRFYPYQWSAPLEDESTASWEKRLEIELKEGLFYQRNADAIVRWKATLTVNTLAEIERAPDSAHATRLLLLDIFDGVVRRKAVSAHDLAVRAHDAASVCQTNAAQIPAVTADQIAYRALYPVAEYQYQIDDRVSVTREVWSPIVKDDPVACSLPVSWQRFKFGNNSDQPLVITVAQVLSNLLGANAIKSRPGVQDSACYLSTNPIGLTNNELNLASRQSRHFKGVSMKQESERQCDIEGEIVFGVMLDESSDWQVTNKPMVYGSAELRALANALHTGRVNNVFDKGIYSKREPISSVSCASITLQPGEVSDVTFALVLDLPYIRFDGLVSEKKYRHYFHSERRTEELVEHTMLNIESYEAQIAKQQVQLFVDAKEKMGEETAESFATMACNTLSFLAESTVWDIHDSVLVKECADYPFFNSLDVYFYGSFSLLYLLPSLDGCVMNAFADAVLAADPNKRRHWEFVGHDHADLPEAKLEGPRGVTGAVIHDLGSPFDCYPDAYDWHNVKSWKDLAPKFVMMVYRHGVFTGNKSLWYQCWPAVTESLDYLIEMMGPGDTVPLTRGTDDTFDNLSSQGVSIYCASLWAAGLEIAAEMADYIATEKALSRGECYRGLAQRAQQSVTDHLWDEKSGYFHFFATPIEQRHLNSDVYASEQPELADINLALQPLGITLTGDVAHDVATLNDYLCAAIESGIEKTRLQVRFERKAKLQQLVPALLSAEYEQILDVDSSNSFGDALLADTYLKLMGLKGLFSDEQVNKTLDYVYEINFLKNSPLLGVANMTLSQGERHAEFQAQDVWTGVQFSVIAALQHAGKRQQAEHLFETVYRSLYHDAKIPFAAPEGLNCSEQYDLSQIDHLVPRSLVLTDSELIKEAVKELWLLDDGRVSSALPTVWEDFAEKLRGKGIELVLSEAQVLHRALQETGMKYTAGRYFRPGMIFACLAPKAYCQRLSHSD